MYRCVNLDSKTNVIYMHTYVPIGVVMELLSITKEKAILSMVHLSCREGETNPLCYIHLHFN